MRFVCLCVAALALSSISCGDSDEDGGPPDAAGAAHVDGGVSDGSGGGNGGSGGSGDGDGDTTGCESDPCGDHGSCVEAADGYSCECDAGYEDDGTSCVDVNECKADEPACGDNSECTNEPGSFSCACLEGFEDKDGTCEDIDECDVKKDPCGDFGTCKNQDGGYKCNCDFGYEEKDGTCVDIKECDADPCGPGSCDEPTPGVYICTCDTGYGLNEDETTCVDINECVTLDPCDPGVCANTDGGYTCTCPNLYEVEDGACVLQPCNTTGTWVGRITQQQTLSASTITCSDASNSTLYNYDIRRITETGTEITMVITSCGGDTADLCSYDHMNVAQVAWGQDFPASIWGNLPTSTIVLDTTNDLAGLPLYPGDPFTSGKVAVWVGVDPSMRDQDDFALDGTMASTWPSHDSDGDGLAGVTSYARHVNRATDYPALFGVETITTSTECGGDPYQYLPVGWSLDFTPDPCFTIYDTFAKRVMVAARNVTEFNGSVSETTCDEISGPLKNTVAHTWMYACTLDDGMACDQGVVDAFNAAAPSGGVSPTSASFDMKRVSTNPAFSGIDCADVEAMFP